jgi:hypothetical protein
MGIPLQVPIMKSKLYEQFAHQENLKFLDLALNALIKNQGG